MTITFNFGGSTLATQITQGAPADVFASASDHDDEHRRRRRATPRRRRRSPGTCSRSRRPPGNPEPVDLAGGPRPSAGREGRALRPAGAVRRGGAAAVRAPPASRVTPVEPGGGRQVGADARCELGEVDAGIVYVTDVQAGGRHGDGVDVPRADQNVTNDYPIAALTSSAERGDARRRSSPTCSPRAGQKVLQRAGFRPREPSRAAPARRRRPWPVARPGGAGARCSSRCPLVGLLHPRPVGAPGRAS